jgi:hypothetical protein
MSYGRTKYNNTKTEIDGIVFDSKKESNRYMELNMLQKAGIINNLLLQCKFELIPAHTVNGKKIRPVVYRADFTYYSKDGSFHVEDVKGVRTKEYLLKKKMFSYLFNREIEEV